MSPSQIARASHVSARVRCDFRIATPEVQLIQWMPARGQSVMLQRSVIGPLR